MPEDRTALIIGAGIGGLAAAIALQRVGWEVRIHERTVEARELGFGLLLAPNALAALEELGVRHGVAAQAAAGGVEIRRLNGAVIRRFDGAFAGGAVVALRPELYGALLERVGSGALILGSEVVAVSPSGLRPTVHFRDGSTQTASVVIGADGVGSAVRRMLHPNETPARPSGYASVRGVAYEATQHLSGLQAVAYLDRGLEAAAVRAGASGSAIYWYLSLLAADLGAGATSARIVAEVMRRGDAALRSILGATTTENMRFDELLRRNPLRSWGKGRVTLLGDAAHPMLPHTGQGAAQALEDAVALGLALSRYASVEEGLGRYEAVRSCRTSRFVRLGPRIARMTTTRNSLIDILRTSMLRVVPERLVMGVIAGGADPHRVLR
jgi:2-polyprenyl-6-methoxyphenol hydroxylase-like FAD-dependent oxidoreductase